MLVVAGVVALILSFIFLGGDEDDSNWGCGCLVLGIALIVLGFQIG